jgi:hypothetical protein
MALGRAWAAHGTEVGSLVSMASAKSHPPASGERVDLGLVQCAPTIGLFELPAFLLEVRITTKVFPGEAGRVERPKFLVRARVPPVGVAHRCRLHCHVAVQSACGDDKSEGGGSVRPGGATRVAVAARDATAASVARPHEEGVDNRFRSSNGLAPGGSPRPVARVRARMPDRCGGRSGRPRASRPLPPPHRVGADMSRDAVRRNSSGRRRWVRCRKQVGQAVVFSCVGPYELQYLSFVLRMPCSSRDA